MAKNLFAAAKEKGAAASTKKSDKEIVDITDPSFHANLHRLSTLNSEIDRLSSEASALAATVKERGIEEFISLYIRNRKYPGSFLISAKGVKKLDPASLMFIPTDKYIKIDEARARELQKEFGEKVVEEKTTYTMNAELVEKYGELLSEAIWKIKGISDDDKAKLIGAKQDYVVAKGTISEALEYTNDIEHLLTEVKPIYQLKNVKVDKAEE